MNDKAFRKHNIFLSIFCLAFTLVSLLSFDNIMNNSYVIEPDKYLTLVNTDRIHNGGTVGSLHRLKDGVELQCDFKRTYSKPFREVESVLSKKAKV